MLRLPSRARGTGLGAAGLGPGGEAGFGAAATGQSHSGPARPGPAKVSSSGEPGHSVGTDSAPRPGLRERVSLQLAAHERPREDEEAPRRRQSPGLRPRVQSAGVSLESGGSQRSREGPPGPPSSWSRTTRRGPETPGPGARGQSPGGGAGPGPPPCTSALAAPGVPAGPFRDSRRHAAQPPAAGRPGPRTRGRRGATAARTRHPLPSEARSSRCVLSPRGGAQVTAHPTWPLREAPRRRGKQTRRPGLRPPARGDFRRKFCREKTGIKPRRKTEGCIGRESNPGLPRGRREFYH